MYDGATDKCARLPQITRFSIDSAVTRNFGWSDSVKSTRKVVGETRKRDIFNECTKQSCNSGMYHRVACGVHDSELVQTDI